MECAYAAERAEKLRVKVTNRLMGGLLVMEIPLHGFNMTRGKTGSSKRSEKASQNTRVVKSLRTQVRLLD